MLSVICPIFQEEAYIAACIESVIAQDYPKENIELLFVDGMSSDRTREIIRIYQKSYPWIKLLDNPHRIVPWALNIGIGAAVGDTIMRLDAHAEYPTNYISRLTHALCEFNADNVGGVCRTLPATNSTKCIAIAEAMSCSFGMGNSRFRVGSSQVCQTDTVPFGCFKKDIFDRIGLFDTDLTRNQDDELNGRIVKSGGKIYLLPDVVIDYYARNSLRKTYRMFYQYGLFKPLVNKKLGSPATVRQFFPVLFLSGLVTGAFLSIFSGIFLCIYLSVLVLYVVLGAGIGVKQALRHRRFSLIVLMPCTFFIIHAGYGIGYLKGIWNIVFKKNTSAEINR